MKVKAKTHQVELGKVVFVATAAEGEVERTLVGALYATGYQFQNGSYSNRSHWFTFDEALSAVVLGIEAREAELRAKLRRLTKRRRYLLSPAYKNQVMSTPYKVVDLTGGEKRKRTRYLKNVTVPEQYVYPGCLVYVVITPLTRSRVDGDVYRPYPHFVLETQVRSVSFSADGTVHYNFVTPFAVEEFFLSQAEAVRHLSRFSEPGTLETVPYVSQAEEQAQLLQGDVPF